MELSIDIDSKQFSSVITYDGGVVRFSPQKNCWINLNPIDNPLTIEENFETVEELEKQLMYSFVLYDSEKIKKYFFQLLELYKNLNLIEKAKIIMKQIVKISKENEKDYFGIPLQELVDESLKFLQPDFEDIDKILE